LPGTDSKEEVDKKRYKGKWVRKNEEGGRNAPKWKNHNCDRTRKLSKTRIGRNKQRKCEKQEKTERDRKRKSARRGAR